MNAFIFIMISAASWFIGVWGWSQIIGSIQNIRANKKFVITLVIWIVLYAALTFVVLRFLRSWVIAYAIGMGIALVMVLVQGKIE